MLCFLFMLDGWESNPRPIGYTSSTIFIAAWTISSPSPISDHVGIVRVRSSSPEPKKCSYKVLPEGIVSEPFSIYGRTYVSLSRRVLLCTPNNHTWKLGCELPYRSTWDLRRFLVLHNTICVYKIPPLRDNSLRWHPLISKRSC